MSDDPVRKALALVAEAYWTLEKLTARPNPLLPDAKPDNKPKLTKRDVKTIRDMYRAGAKQSELAVDFDVHPATISRTVRGIYNR